MVRGYITIEQSKHLVELGLDPDTADMAYFLWKKDGSVISSTIVSPTPFVLDGTECKGEDAVFDYIYCWSLTALLELMPVYINDDNYFLVIEKDETYLNEPIWKVSYKHFSKEDDIVERRASLIDAAFEMVCWLIEQGHIKVNK